MSKDSELQPLISSQNNTEQKNTFKAALYMLSYVIGFSLSQLFTKLLLQRNPEMDSIQLLSLRMTVHFITMCVFINKDLKRICYDEISNNLSFPVAIRALSIVLSFFCLIQSITTLPLVEVILVINMAPLVTVVLGYFILNDRVKFIELCTLICSFIGIVVMILGAYLQNPVTDDKEGDIGNQKMFAFCLCLIGCLSIAYGAIVQRQIRTLDVRVASFYTGLIGLCVSMPITLFSKGRFQFLQDFDGIDYMLLIIYGICSSLVFIASAVAFKLDSPSKLQIYNYLQPIIQILFDVMIFKTPFYSIEIIGITIVFVSNMVVAVDKWQSYQNSIKTINQ